MNKNIFLTYFLSFGIFTSLYGQLIVKGKVLNQNNNIPISYANIGILNSKFGTISNRDGSFSISIEDSLVNKKLIFSAIGYEKKSLPLKTMTYNKNIIIYLNEKEIALNEVVLSAPIKRIKEKHAWLGNHKKNLFVQGTMQVDSATAGGATALLIEKEDDFDLQFISKARLFISKNTEPEFKVRVRFLEVDKSNNNLPGDDLINESIVVTTDIKRGWLTFDLSSFNFEVNKTSFFLVFEWILEDKDRIRLFNNFNKYVESNPNKIKRDSVLIDGKKVPSASISSSAPIPLIIFGDSRTQSALKKHKCYIRKSSFAKWKRARGILSAKVLMTNRP